MNGVRLNILIFLQQKVILTLNGLNKELLIVCLRLRFCHQIQVTFDAKLATKINNKQLSVFRDFRISTKNTGGTVF